MNVLDETTVRSFRSTDKCSYAHPLEPDWRQVTVNSVFGEYPDRHCPVIEPWYAKRR